MKTRFFVPVLLLLGLVASHASAQTVINSVPYTISTSGHYVLSANLNSNVANKPAITIAAPSVILDLGGYFVTGPYNTAATGSQNSVILVNDVPNVTIRNGLVAGAAYGIYFSATTATNSRNYVVDSVTVTRCYLGGIWFNSAIGAPGSLVRNCSISLMGNSTSSTNTDVSGIYPYGGVRVENNNIGNLTATGTGQSFGINAAGSDFCIGNTIFNCTVGISGSTYLNNLTNGVTTNFEYGGAATGNF